MPQVELTSIDIRPKKKTGEDFDVAEVCLSASDKGFSLSFKVQVLYEGSVDKAVERAVSKLVEVTQELNR